MDMSEDRITAQEREIEVPGAKQKDEKIFQMWRLSEKKDPRTLALLIHDTTAHYLPNVHSPPLRWIQNPVLF